MKLVKKGSVKEIYEISEGELIFNFTDQISVFDKVITTLVPNKGETLCRTTAYWFNRLDRLGIPHHFLEFIPPRQVRTKKVDIIRDYSLMGPDTVNYLIPLEFISRDYVAGSLYDRLNEGKISPESLGFNDLPVYGEKLKEPFLEVSTKLERVDRLLDDEEALKISGLTESEYEGIKDTVRMIDRELASVEDRGLIHVDGKKEFAMDENREVMLIDTFGTADEDRFWDLQSYRKGEFVELSKETVRQHYRQTGYKDRLYDARERGEAEPDIPPMPDDLVKKTSSSYIELFERITGEKF